MVIVRENEKEYLEKAYEELRKSENIPAVKKLQYGENLGHGLFKLKLKNNRCPMFTRDGKCSVHEKKPLDCLLWPTTFAADKEDGLIMLDVKCPATRSGEIPNSLYQIQLPSKELVTSEQKKIYAQHNMNSYQMDRLVDVRSLGFAKAQNLLHKWQKKRDSVQIKIKSTWSKVEIYLLRLQKDFESQIHAREVLSGFRWIVGIAFALCLESALNSLHSSFKPSLQSGDFWPFVWPFIFTVVMFVIFLLDMFRLFVPLPFIFTKMIREGPNPKNNDPSIPQSIINRLLFISLVTFCFTFLASKSLNLFNYFFFFMWVQLADYFWYFKLKKPDVIGRGETKCTAILDTLSKKIDNYVWRHTRIEFIKNIFIRDKRSLAMVNQLSNLFKFEVRELTQHIYAQKAQIEEKKQAHLLNYGQNIDTLNNIIINVNKHQAYSRIAAADFMICLFLVFLLTTKDRFSYQVYINPDYIIIVFVVLHVINIFYDYLKNTPDYIQKLKIMTEV